MNYPKILFILTFFTISSFVMAQGIKFEDYFEDHTMRIDYHHTGDAKTEIISIDKIYKYGTWAGSLTKLIDNFNNGAYYHKIYDAESGELIYSKGFDSYFKEYRLSGPAIDGVIKAFHESAIIPYPKKKIKFTLSKRDKYNKLNEIWSTEIDPADIMISRQNFTDNDVKVYKSHYSGDPHTKVDIAIIGDGYTAEEETKFKEDVEKFTKYFFEVEPYKSEKDKFNIYGVLKPSEESGVDEPRANIYKNTALSSTFNSMGSERYLLTEDNKALRDIAAHVSYDALYIMVNHKRYGGGGIYNFYCTFTADNQFQKYLFVHEFGHSFAGLADEYYTSSIAYNDFYPAGIEPVEPNITRLLDKKNIKWKHLLSPGIEIPTPWGKEEYDSTDYKWQALRRKLNDNIAKLKRENASKEEIKAAELDYDKRDRERSKRVDEYMKAQEHYGKVGAFEGAGYVSEGVYRPMLDCLMFSKSDIPFCKVCEEAIKKVIKHYTE
ncbi:MAG: M64 family metallopeptidase [Ignavibacteria bacterium]|jgi:hypothetical protein